MMEYKSISQWSSVISTAIQGTLLASATTIIRTNGDSYVTRGRTRPQKVDAKEKNKTDHVKQASEINNYAGESATKNQILY